MSDWTASTLSEALGPHRGQTEPPRVLLLVKVEVKKKLLLVYLRFRGQKNSKVKFSRLQGVR